MKSVNGNIYGKPKANDYEYPRLTVDIQHSTTDAHNSMMDVRMLIPLSRWSSIFICHDINDWIKNVHDLSMDIHNSVMEIRGLR